MTPEATTAWLGNTHPALRRAWHPVARSRDLTDAPLGTELLGEHWCLARLDGTLVAFLDECPHRLAPLSAGRLVDGTLQCAYHGYRFDPTGACTTIPATTPGTPIPPRARCRPAAAVAEHAGLIWLAPDDPLTPLPEVPEHTDPAFVACELPPQDWHAAAAQMADNFLDLGHFPFLHLATFGAPDDLVVGDYTVTRDGWRFTVDHHHETKALADSHHPDAGYEVVHRHDHFAFTAPHHLVLRIAYPDSTLTITFFHQPLGDGRTRLWACDYRDDIDPTPDAIAATVDFQLAVAAEDKALLERFHHKAVPLDPTREVHTKADRITLELRRVLADLVAATT